MKFKLWHLNWLTFPISIYNSYCFINLLEKYPNAPVWIIVFMILMLAVCFWCVYDSAKRIFINSGAEDWVIKYGREHKWFRQVTIFCTYLFVLPIMIPIEFGKGLSYFLISFVSGVVSEYCDFYKFLRNWKNV